MMGHPLKQGLKLVMLGTAEEILVVMMGHPLKQGLKLTLPRPYVSRTPEYDGTSIKTRIETVSL